MHKQFDVNNGVVMVWHLSVHCVGCVKISPTLNTYVLLW